MKNWIDIRRWERPDRPQPVYKGALSLWEAPLYAAIAAASLLCSVRPPAEPGLDVRTHAWQPPCGWVVTSLPADATVAQRAAIWSQTANPGRTSPEPPLDVRTHLSAPSESGWIFKNLPAASPPTVAQTIPAMAQASAGFRTPAAAKLDVRYHFSDTTFGVPDDATAAQQAAIWSAVGNPGRTPMEPLLDVRTHTWQPPAGWLFASLPADSTTAQRAAVWSQSANPGRTPDRGGDVRRIQTEPSFGWAWKITDSTLATWLPAFDAQQASVRTGMEPLLDVRTHTWQAPLGWIAAMFVQDATVAQQAAVWSQQANPGRTGARAGLENRHTWQPPLGWVVINFAPDATVGQQAAIWAQQVNAQYGRTRERGGDVRRIQTEPAFTWVAKVVDGIVAKWIPVFTSQASSRTAQRLVLDVRAVSDMPEIAWRVPILPPPPTFNPAWVLFDDDYLGPWDKGVE